ncbi:MAG: hypothetical protein WCI56_05460 [Hyphomicrobiales bacterium]
MRTIFAALIIFSLVPVVTVSMVSEASAQACRQKCNDEEIACLKRTNNKSQCGDKAKTCASKCK